MNIIRRFPEFIAGILGLSLGLLSTVVLITHDVPSIPLNKYERAQNQTVIVKTESGTGSGVVIVRHNRIFVWTAAHVVADQSQATVKRLIHFEGHKAGEVAFKARVINRNEGLDFALLWLDAPAIGYFEGAAFDTITFPKVGTEVFHVGNFLGESFDGSVSLGLISQVGIFPGDVDGWHWPVSDQIAGTIVPGSSGGPIFRSDNGKVLGLVVGGVGRGSLGFASYVPFRIISSDATIRWALWGTECPPDSVLLEMALKNFIKPVVAEEINPYE